MEPATAPASETFESDVLAGKEVTPRPADFQRKVEILWREMIEDGISEADALEVAMRGIVREAKERALEAGGWNRQELHAKASVLERAADEMLEKACEELEAI